MTATYPIVLTDQPTIWRGDAFSWTLTLNNADNSPVNLLTAYGTSWASQLRTSLDASTHVDFAVDTTNAASGRLVLSLTGSQTQGMLRGKSNYGFDVQATGGTVSPFTVWTGHVSVDGEYTHA